MRDDGEANDAAFEIPESRRGLVPLKVAAHAEGFVCAQPAILSINIIMQPYPDHWAGASVNPSDSRVTINAGQPGTPPGMNYDGVGVNGPPAFDIFWDEERPNLNARETYRLTTESQWDTNAGCIPPPNSIEEGSMQFTAFMPDIIVDTNDTSVPSDCAADPSLAQCQTATLEPEGDSPAIQAFALTILVGVVAVALRRRRA